MRTLLVAAVVALATVMTAVPALGRVRTLEVDTNRVEFETITAPGHTYAADGITITNISDEPVALDFAIELTKPKDWDQVYSPLVIEEAGIPPSWDPCDVLAPGATCVVYLTFQTDRAGTYAGWLWINDTYRVKMRGVAN